MLRLLSAMLFVLLVLFAGSPASAGEFVQVRTGLGDVVLVPTNQFVFDDFGPAVLIGRSPSLTIVSERSRLAVVDLDRKVKIIVRPRPRPVVIVR